jgi:hypothetical protein
MSQYLSGALIVVNSAALRHRLSATLSNGGMRTVEEVRRIRLSLLLKEFGSYAILNEKLDRPRRDSTLSQIANESANSKGGSPKTMGSPMARALEHACGKEPAWMDTDPDLWPFEGVDHSAIRALDRRNLDRLEGALISTAIQLGLDVQKRTAA